MLRCGDDLLPGFRTRIPPTVMSPAELLSRTGRPLYLLGEGLKYHRRELAPEGEKVIWLEKKYHQPRAANVHRLGRLRARAGLFTETDKLMPIYLRRPEAVEKWEKLHGKD